MSEVLEKYGLNFKLFIDKESFIAESTSIKNEILINYLIAIYNLKVIQEFIDEISDILQGLISEGGDDVSLAIVIVDARNAKFYKWDSYQANNPELQIPTEDFKNILIEWQKFIKSHSQIN